MDTTIEVQAKYIMAACEIIDSGTTDSVDGVHFTRDSKGKLVVCATDGEGMVLYRLDADASAFNFTIPTRLAKTVKGVKNKYQTAVVTAEEFNPGQKEPAKVTVTFAGGTFEDITLESLAGSFGSYPDVRKFAHSLRERLGSPGEPSWVRPSFITKLAKSLRVADYLPDMMRLEHNGVDVTKIVISKHVDVRAPEPDFVCLVSPMKRDAVREDSELFSDL